MQLYATRLTAAAGFAVWGIPLFSWGNGAELVLGLDKSGHSCAWEEVGSCVPLGILERENWSFYLIPRPRSVHAPMGMRILSCLSARTVPMVSSGSRSNRPKFRKRSR